LLVEVQDEGTGMSGEQLETLFTNRAEPGYGTMGERGTGLGLMLSREFAEQNNGAINVQSMPGQGTLFVLSLPAQEDEERMWS
jgi:signal transduction histidine kinase